MSQVTGKKVAVTPMPTPSGTSGAIIDSFNTQDDQTVNAPSIHIVKDALTTINDNLNGFKYYPIGTQLVALVADDSFYKDANDKYVLADSTTGQALIDGVTYKALASTEDTRGMVGADSAVPFNKLSDINPSKLEEEPFVISVKKITGSICYASLPCDGYKKVALYFNRTDLDMSYCFVKKDGTETSYTALSYKVWTNYIDILDDYLYIKFKSTTGSGGYALSTFYSLLA